LEKIAVHIEQRITDTVKAMLKLAIDKDNINTYLDHTYDLQCIKQGEPVWEAVYAFACYAAARYIFTTIDDPTKINDEDAVHILESHKRFSDYSLEPLEALYSSIKKTNEKRPDDSLKRILVHIRMALGFALLGHNENAKAKSLFHEIARVPISHNERGIFEDPDIVNLTADIMAAKSLIANYLAPHYEMQTDYAEALYLVTQGNACFSTGLYWVEPIHGLIDKWIQQCEEYDKLESSDIPSLAWVDLFAEVSEILSQTVIADNLNSTPQDCNVDSAQFIAWKFGQIAANFSYRDIRWRDNPKEKLFYLLDAVHDYGFSVNGFNRSMDVVVDTMHIVGSIICEYDHNKNMRELKEFYMRMWAMSSSTSQCSLTDINPSIDLYWAIRIGWCDKLTELMEEEKTESLPISTSTPPIIQDLQTIKDIVSTIAINQFKEINDRLPPSNNDIVQHIRSKLSDIGHDLPSTIMNCLVKAHKYYRTEVNDDDAKVWFCKSVEAAFNHCLVSPLVDYMKKEHMKSITLCFPPPTGTEKKREQDLKSMGLRPWSQVLQLSTSALSLGALSSLGIQEFNRFLKAHLKASRLPSFIHLAESLRLAQNLRSGGAHFEDASTRYDKEKRELEDLRKLVLGIDQTSVITLIFKLLLPRP
jgi:hypothetical protein